MAYKTMLLLPILLGCGVPPPMYENKCAVTPYIRCLSELPETKPARVQEAENLAKALLVEAGVITAEAHDEKAAGFTLDVHAVNNWVDQWGREVSGLTWPGSIEVGADLTALLHEEIHMIHIGVPGDSDHAEWDRLGYWGLDMFYTDLLSGNAWTCTEGSGMTHAMVDGLRKHGRAIDDFIAKNPKCLNKD